jgi:hypothetical protein
MKVDLISGEAGVWQASGLAAGKTDENHPETAQCQIEDINHRKIVFLLRFLGSDTRGRRRSAEVKLVQCP